MPSNKSHHGQGQNQIGKDTNPNKTVTASVNSIQTYFSLLPTKRVMSFSQFLRSFLPPPTTEIAGVATEYQTWLLEEVELRFSLHLTTSQEMADRTTKFKGR
ncbi:hypothetical protein TNCT_179001 [Trichonephila clavata]|uniref:Uncharacterized protein n=1 Tax=Trichonephila clavata TaxID=2740835 RepID=A0A8X6FZ34_TRICU|nr:hypothetical protein TNCT_179001 [Trichonephila clavata]